MPGQLDIMAARVQAWVNAAPQSPFAHILMATVLIKRAWNIRGNALAKDVKPEAWDPYWNYLQQASDYLDKSKPVSSVDMNWYSLKLQIAN